VGDDATPEETPGTGPTPPDAEGDAAASQPADVTGDAPTQELPAVQGDLLEGAADADVAASEPTAADEQAADEQAADVADEDQDALADEGDADESTAESEAADTEPGGEVSEATSEAATEDATAEATEEAAAPDDAGAPDEPENEDEVSPQAPVTLPVAAPVAAPASASAEEPPAAVADGPAHAAKRPSVWRSILTVVAVLAIVAGAALAGFAYGRTSAPGPDIVVQGEPAIEEPPKAEAMPSTIPPLLSVQVQAAGAPTAVLTPAAGLDDTSGSATGYRVVNAGISGGQIAGVLARTFGLKGSTIQQDGTWTVGKEGGPMLVVEDDALFSWTYRDAEKLANPFVGQQLEPADAIELANTLLAGIGVDTSSIDWQVARYFDRTAVTAWQLVADQRTQLRWLLAFDPEGAVVEAAGFSASLEPAGSYSVVGAATAVNRSTTAPWWTLGPTQVDPADLPPAEDQPVDGQASAQQPSAEPSAQAASSDAFVSDEPTFEPLPSTGTDAPTAGATTTPPATPTADAEAQPGLVVPVDQVVVTEAELGLGQFWQADGSVLMLPAYVLTGLDGSRWSLIAVSDEYVDFTPSAAPQ